MQMPIALVCVLGVVCVWAEKQQGSDRIVRQMRSATQYPDEATAAEIQTILDRHNHHRRQAGADNMEHMTWNAELAAKAVELSSTCRVEHDMLEWEGSPYPRVGQNLYLNTYPGYELAVDGWHDSEIGYYDFDSNTCSDVCGHYTQVVWDTSREVGCGRHYCELAYDDDGRQWNNVYVTTCNYGPPGNYDRQPFSVGPACTACESGSGICNDGLCDSDCTGSHCTCELSCGSHGSLNTAECTCSCDDGWFGTSCDQECDNYNPSCGANPGWPKSFCSVYDLVYQSCPLLCDRCVPAGGFVCEDTHEYCGANPGWPVTWCTNPDAPYVRDYCPAMCEVCTP